MKLSRAELGLLEPIVLGAGGKPWGTRAWLRGGWGRGGGGGGPGDLSLSLSLSLFFFLIFLGLYLQHMEVPRLEVQSELHLRPTPQLTETPNP